jgi:hemolysin activation/secretion protein
MLNIKFLPYALLALSPGVFAQQLPNGGSQMQQIPPAPIPEKAVPKVEFQPGGVLATPTAADSQKITVKRLSVTGAKAYSEAQLLAVTGFQPGSELTLSDLRAMAARIADYYHRNGYFVAQAYLPAQDIKDGAVSIAVIDGQYGKITLRNQTNLSDGLANDLLGGINSGDPITSAPLENRLLLLSDVPGVNVKSTLVPGATAGTSDLIVDLTPGKRISGSIDADNAGSRYTGQYRVGATVNLNNPTGHGDVASLRVLTSGSGLNYARASYQTRVGKATVGAAYSHLRYVLGEEFESLDASGTVKTASIYGSYPLIRSRNNNLFAGLAFEDRRFQDRVGSISSVADKKAQVLIASLYGDHRDNLGGGGVSSYSLALSAGELDLQTPAVRLQDAATAQSNGNYNKLGFSAMRLQRVTDSISLYAAINGQLASKNLDSSEKMELGGMYGVRAYPEGETFADQGYIVNLEARLQLPKFSEKMPGQMQLIGFVDSGTVTINKNPWAAGSNHRTLSGAGVGINWSESNNFMVRAYYARKLGNEVATSAPDRSGRFWIQLVKYF